jgi:hypothetical protein
MSGAPDEFARSQLARIEEQLEVIEAMLREAILRDRAERFAPIDPGLQSKQAADELNMNRRAVKVKKRWIRRPATLEQIETAVRRLLEEDRLRREERLTALIAAHKPEPVKAKETQSPFVRRKEAIRLLGSRSVLEDCEKGRWLAASVRRPRLVLYKRTDVMAAAYRISQGEYP